MNRDRVGRREPHLCRYSRHVPLSREARRLRTAFELFEAGVRMMTERLRRLHPEASPAELEDLLREWLLSRPGAETEDAVGVPDTWPRAS